LLFGDPVQVPVLRDRIICRAQAGPRAELESLGRRHRSAPGLGL
jgi:hypothetical protein